MGRCKITMKFRDTSRLLDVPHVRMTGGDSVAEVVKNVIDKVSFCSRIYLIQYRRQQSWRGDLQGWNQVLYGQNSSVARRPGSWRMNRH